MFSTQWYHTKFEYSRDLCIIRIVTVVGSNTSALCIRGNNARQIYRHTLGLLLGLETALPSLGL